MAACLAWTAVVSHQAAATLWRLPGFEPGRIELSLVHPRQLRLSHIVHRPASLRPVDMTTIEGIPVTTPARTLIDLAGTVSGDQLEEALDDALRRRLVTVQRLRHRLEDVGGRGRKGSGVLARLLDARANTTQVPQNVFETRLIRVLRSGGLPTPIVQHEVQTDRGLAVLDFAYVDGRVAIEADGFRWHSSRQQWDRDRARRNALTKLGWTLIHVTWFQLSNHPDEVVETVRETLAVTRARRL